MSGLHSSLKCETRDCDVRQRRSAAARCKTGAARLEIGATAGPATSGAFAPPPSPRRPHSHIECTAACESESENVEASAPL